MALAGPTGTLPALSGLAHVEPFGEMVAAGVGPAGRAAARRGARHRRAGELSGGRVRLATGTLYTALDRLTAEGLVELVREEIVNGRVRRSYGLTPPGAGALRAEAARMAEAARLVTDRGRGLKAAGPARKASPA
jgi:PadR family transcriptional regulator, regulatory protein PadR